MPKGLTIEELERRVKAERAAFLKTKGAESELHRVRYRALRRRLLKRRGHTHLDND